MNRDAILAIAEKDVRAVRQSRQMMIPLVVVPILFVVVLPAAVVLLPRLVEVPTSTYGFTDQMLETMPASIRAEVSGYSDAETMVYLAVNYLFGPLFLVIPLMVSNIVASASFAGERERHTIEGLLSAPVSNVELFVGKALAAFVPAVLAALGGFVGYTVVVDLLTYGQFGRLLLPNLLWILLVCWLVPAVSFFGLGVTVIVSMRARGYEEAQQIAGVVVLPIVAIVLLQVAGVLFLSTTVILAIGGLFWLFDVALVWFGQRLFRREELLLGPT